jgi:hypothetical protein
MNIKIKWIALFVVLLLAGKGVQAQNSMFSTSLNAGLSFPILDNGRGIHLGVNPAFRIGDRFELEGQLSYVYTKITHSFLSGNTGYDHAINSLVGARYYFNSKNNRIRPYVNFLVGGMISKEKLNNTNYSPEISLGLSVGAFIEIYRFVGGISIETPRNFTFKLGYRIIS